ncbi:heat repeat domain protein [Dissulfurispira thermophila]|uniref:Heat repeat domain protein n=2 Tax=root TaxID=1 RepID=A0A7G1GYD5_9BACT|nr:HEAT repeat domain-containing protein [Dissulfurispira thermophila]BCB95374.1 heat repeat domain protein [Dissulfurispira thermophila]
MDKNQETGNDEELKTMILDYMERGFLENIIDMFKHDENLFPLIIDMIKDERMRVKLGVTALVEELIRYKPEPLIRMIPAIAELLQDENPTVRGDGANLLDIIGHKDALPFLLNAQSDTDANVREIVRDAIQNIQLLS